MTPLVLRQYCQVASMAYVALPFYRSSFFTKMNFPYLKNNVKHIAVEFHMNAYKGCVGQWQKFRDGLLQQFDTNQVRFLEHEDREKAYDDDFLNAGDFSKWSSFMLYI